MKIGKMIAEVICSVFKKPATVLYPGEKLHMAADYRGKLNFLPEKCIGCKMCMRDCPAGAITINKLGEKQFEAVIELGRCIYCGQCVDSCVKKALEITQEIELAQLDSKKLRVVFRANPESEPAKET